MSKKKIITYGTFDLFHIGHLNLFRRLKEIGDYLIVGVSTDEFNAIKNKKSFFPFKDRFEIVRSVKYVDMVIPEKSWEQKINDIKKYNIDIFSIGMDWKGKFDFLNKFCEVIYLPRTKGISSTNIKNMLNSLDNYKNIIDNFKTVDFVRLKKSLDLLEQLKKNLQ